MTNQAMPDLGLNQRFDFGYGVNQSIGVGAEQSLGVYPGQGLLPEEKDRVADLGDQLSFDLSGLKPVVAAFLTVRLDTRLGVHVWALLDTRDEATEQRLAEAERRLLTFFPEIVFDFSTIHLRGRDPLQFIPAAARPVKVEDPRIAAHFIRTAATGTPTNAGT